MGWHVGALLGALGIAGQVLGAEPDAAPQEEAISPWETTVTLRGAGGYKSNLLLSDFNVEESAFVQTAVDFFAFHAPLENLWEFSEFFTIEDRCYLAKDTDVDKEILILSSADLRRIVGEKFKPGLNLEYFYSDQVFDA